MGEGEAVYRVMMPSPKKFPKSMDLCWRLLGTWPTHSSPLRFFLKLLIELWNRIAQMLQIFSFLIKMELLLTVPDIYSWLFSYFRKY